MKSLKPCPGCGARFADVAGPTHRYLESSPACWATYGEVLAREYSDPAYYAVHRLSVDAYAIQHPGKPSPQTIQSAAVHLISLYLVLERDVDLQRATRAMRTAVKTKGRFVWLTPPPALGSITVADVHMAKTVEEHKRLVRAWADSVWSAWAPHHATIRSWATDKFQ
ncbi:MAG: DUF5946 family protein [Gammaproteobacteria bacterium]